MIKKIHAIAYRCNIARPVCRVMLGHEHSHTHRMAVGAVVMACGVAIAKATGRSEYELICYIGDGIGYGIHGLGLTPYIEFIVGKFAEA